MDSTTDRIQESIRRHINLQKHGRAKRTENNQPVEQQNLVKAVNCGKQKLKESRVKSVPAKHAKSSTDTSAASTEPHQPKVTLGAPEMKIGEKTTAPDESTSIFVAPPSSQGGLLARLWTYNIFPLVEHEFRGPKLAHVRSLCRFFSANIPPPPLHVCFSSSTMVSTRSFIAAQSDFELSSNENQVASTEPSSLEDLITAVNKKNTIITQIVLTVKDCSPPSIKLSPAVNPYQGSIFKLAWINYKNDHDLAGQRILVGRSTGKKYTEEGLSLSKDSEVSTCHGDFRTQDGKICFVDLESTNGTRLNGEVLKPHTCYPIHENDVLSLGATTMVVSFLNKNNKSLLENSISEIWLLEGKYDSSTLLSSNNNLHQHQRKLTLPSNISLYGAGQDLTTILDVPIEVMCCSSNVISSHPRHAIFDSDSDSDSDENDVTSCSVKSVGSSGGSKLQFLTLATSEPSNQKNGWALHIKMNQTSYYTKTTPPLQCHLRIYASHIDFIGQQVEGINSTYYANEWRHMQETHSTRAEVNGGDAVVVASGARLHMSDCKFANIPSSGILSKGNVKLNNITMNNICLTAIACFGKNASMQHRISNLRDVSVSNCIGKKNQGIGIQASNSHLNLVQCRTETNHTGVFFSNNSVASVYDLQSLHNKYSGMLARSGSQVNMYGSATSISNCCEYVKEGNDCHLKLDQYNDDGINPNQKGLTQYFAIQAEHSSQIICHMPKTELNLKNNGAQFNIGGQGTTKFGKITYYDIKNKIDLSRSLGLKDWQFFQHRVRVNHRTILVDWLVEVVDEYSLSSETLFAAVDYIDRYLGFKQVHRHKLQLLGCACILLTSKRFENFILPVRELVYISDNTYTHHEIIKMEKSVCQVLQFDKSTEHMDVWTTTRYLKYYLDRSEEEQEQEQEQKGETKTKAAGDKTKAAGDTNQDNVTFLAQYFIELALQDYDMLEFQPSVIAAAALSLSRRTLNVASNASFNRHQNHPQNDFRLLCEMMLHKLHRKDAGKDVVVKKGNQLKAVHDKYNNDKYNMVSTKIIPLTPTMFQKSCGWGDTSYRKKFRHYKKMKSNNKMNTTKR